MKPTKQMQSIANRAAKILKLSPVPIFTVKKQRRGYAHTSDGHFSIPLWATQRHEAMMIAYIVHELCHFSQPTFTRVNQGWAQKGWTCRDHGKQFRKLEAETCERFGLRLVYRGKAYLDEIRNLEGEILCVRHGYPSPRIEAAWI